MHKQGKIPSRLSLNHLQRRVSAASPIGQQIVPWPTVDWVNLPPKLAPVRRDATPPASSSASSVTHKRTLTPAPEVESPPAFHPLKPAKKANRLVSVKTISPSASSLATPSIQNGTLHSPSSLMSGSHSLGKNRRDSTRILQRHLRPGVFLAK